jgi:hypothetical protein
MFLQFQKNPSPPPAERERRSEVCHHSHSSMISRKKPECVAQRDAWLWQLQEKEDRESLRPYITRSRTAPIELEGLKDLARRLRLHKSIPGFWREHSTEEELIRILKRHVRAAYLLPRKLSDQEQTASLQPKRPRRPRPSTSAASRQMKLSPVLCTEDGKSLFGRTGGSILLEAMMTMSRLGPSTSMDELRPCTSAVLQGVDRGFPGAGFRPQTENGRSRKGAEDLGGIVVPPASPSLSMGFTSSSTPRGAMRSMGKRSGSNASILSMESSASRLGYQLQSQQQQQQQQNESMELPGTIDEDDYGLLMRIKASQALLRLSAKEGSGVKMLNDGALEAMRKLLDAGHVQVNRVLAACLANLLSDPACIDEVLRREGHAILSAISTGVSDEASLSSCGLALCRCSYTHEHQEKLLTEYGSAQALCYIGQHASPQLRIYAVKGMLNFCGVSGTHPSFTSNVDVYVSCLCNCLSELSRQAGTEQIIMEFVCEALELLCNIPCCAVRAIDLGVLDMLLRISQACGKRPGCAVKLANSVESLAFRKNHHHMVRSGHLEKIGRLLLAAEPSATIEQLCRAAAKISFTDIAAPLMSPFALELVVRSEHHASPAAMESITVLLQNIAYQELLLLRARNGVLSSASKDDPGDSQAPCRLRAPILQWLVRHCADQSSTPEASSCSADAVADELVTRRKCGLFAICYILYLPDSVEALLEGGLISQLRTLKTGGSLAIAEIIGYIAYALGKLAMGCEEGRQSGTQLIKEGFIDICAEILAHHTPDGRNSTAKRNALGAIFCLSADRPNLRDLASFGGVRLVTSGIHHGAWRTTPMDILERQLASLAQICRDPTVRKSIASLSLLEDLAAMAAASPGDFASDGGFAQHGHHVFHLYRCIVSILYNLSGAFGHAREGEQEGDFRCPRSIMLEIVANLTLYNSSGERKNDDPALLLQCARALQEWSEDASFAALMSRYHQMAHVIRSLISRGPNDTLLCTAAALCNMSSAGLMWARRHFPEEETSWIVAPKAVTALVEMCFFRINEDVKIILVKVLHNIMYDVCIRKQVVDNLGLRSLFRIIQVDGSGGRETVSSTLLNLAASDHGANHSALLDAGLLNAVLDLLSSSNRGEDSKLSDAVGIAGASGAVAREEIASTGYVKRASMDITQSDGDEASHLRRDSRNIQGAAFVGPTALLRQNLIAVLLNMVGNGEQLHPKIDTDQLMTALELIGGECEGGALMQQLTTGDEESVVHDSTILLLWLLVQLRLSFIPSIRMLIVRHSEGRSFTRIKSLCMRDPLLGGTSFNQRFDPVFRCLAMAIMVNLSCDRSLYEGGAADLEGQLVVVREYLMQSEADTTAAYRETGRYLDLRHLLCAQLVSNLFSNPDFRPRLSRKGTAGAMARLQTSGGVPRPRGSNDTNSSEQEVVPEGSTCHGEQRSVLYGGNTEAAIASAKFLAGMCILHAHEQPVQYDLPALTVEALCSSIITYSEDRPSVARLCLMGLCGIASPRFVSVLPSIIEAGGLGALRCALLSPALTGSSGEREQLARACAVAIRNLSTVFSGSLLTASRALAVMDSLRQLLKILPGWQALRQHCSIILLHMAEEAPNVILDQCGIAPLLHKATEWRSEPAPRRASQDDHDDDGEGEVDLGQIALYALSRLCTRDYFPPGDDLVKVIDRMVDLTQDQLDRIDEFSSTVLPSLSLSLPDELSAEKWVFQSAPADIADRALQSVDLDGIRPHAIATPEWGLYALQLQHVASSAASSNGVRFATTRNENPIISTQIGYVSSGGQSASITQPILEKILADHAAMPLPEPELLLKYESAPSAGGATSFPVMRVHSEKKESPELDAGMDATSGGCKPTAAAIGHQSNPSPKPRPTLTGISKAAKLNRPR